MKIICDLRVKLVDLTKGNFEKIIQSITNTQNKKHFSKYYKNIGFFFLIFQNNKIHVMKIKLLMIKKFYLFVVFHLFR